MLFASRSELIPIFTLLDSPYQPDGDKRIDVIALMPWGLECNKFGLDAETIAWCYWSDFLSLLPDWAKEDGK